MKRSTMIALTAAPYLGAALIFVTGLQPALQDLSRVNTEIEDHQKEYAILEQKVMQKQSLEARKSALTRQIARLRTSVPARPDMDILMLDLEKMSEQSHTDLIGLEEPELTGSEKKEGLMEHLVKEVGGKVPAKQARKPAPGQTPAEAVSEDPLGLKHVSRRVFISGSYQELLDFLSQLERYQRVVGISEIVLARSDNDPELTRSQAGERGKKLALSKPVMSFLMHVYYLPDDDTDNPHQK
ncbi:MAG: hypothetical protein AB7W16_26990 [Candidatus Obscuribacterales bacterium]